MSTNNQQPLMFGSLTLCAPSNSCDGYKLTHYSTASIDYELIKIPFTSGMVKLNFGIGNSEESSAKLEFDCESMFASPSSMIAKISEIQNKVTDGSHDLDTVNYGLGNDPSSAYLDNCSMRFKLHDVWTSQVNNSANINYWMKFNVTFLQYGFGS